MAKKFYLDTSIWRDYFEDRKDNIKPLGEFAFRFLRYCAKNNFQILYSQLVVSELLKYYSAERVKLIFSQCEKNLVEVFLSDNLKKEAFLLKSKYNVPIPDIAHALLAKENNAILVSRDKHFEELDNIVQVRLPEELI